MHGICSLSENSLKSLKYVCLGVLEEFVKCFFHHSKIEILEQHGTRGGAKSTGEASVLHM